MLSIITAAKFPIRRNTWPQIQSKGKQVSAKLHSMYVLNRLYSQEHPDIMESHYSIGKLEIDV